MDPKSTDPKSFSRKEFLVLTVTLVGGAALEANCSSSDDGTGTGGAWRNRQPGNRGDVRQRRHVRQRGDVRLRRDDGRGGNERQRRHDR